MPRTISISLLFCLLFASFACDRIAPEDRLMVVEDPIDPSKGRSVLIEEFSGVKCVNCPVAAEVIHSIAREYGAKVIPISIHGVASDIGTPTDHLLYSEDGAEYASRFLTSSSLPQAVFSRRTNEQGSRGIASYSLWQGLVRDLRMQEALLSLNLRAKWNAEGGIDVEFRADALEGKQLSGSLKWQLYLLESGIVAPQDSKQGKIADYVHNHILRQALNGVWGETYQLGQSVQKSFPVKVSVQDRTKCQVIAFVFDASTLEVYEAVAQDL